MTDSRAPRSALVTAFDQNYLWPGIVASKTALEHSPDRTHLWILGVGLGAEAHSIIGTTLPEDQTTVLDLGGMTADLPGWQHISPAAWSRLAIGRLLPQHIERAVYVDADTITRNDLTPLFSMDLHGATIAAAVDRPMPTFWHRHEYGLQEDPEANFVLDSGAPLTNAYFNTGVMVMNLPRWRAQEVESKALAMAGSLPRSFILLDQDVVNTLLFDKIKLLDWHKWNWPGYLKAPEAWDASIVHFVSQPKPWVGYPLGAPFNAEYRKAARSVDWKPRPRWIRVRSGLIEATLPNGIVIRRKRISRSLRREKD